MDKNDSIEILTASNGFIVRRSRSPDRDYVATMIDDTLVFQSYKALAKWLGEHFTHRDKEVEKDD
ncbi:MAG TPA: hypothetical protein VJ742_00760 [Nitrososphaera sp.]|nr:hypothetical protein [Nitrososphaera sp.]